MAPDLNSLPPSFTRTTSPIQIRTNMQASPAPPSRQNTSSPRGTSLAAAATMNAADRSRRSSASYQNRGSPRLERLPSGSERRRSQVANTLTLNDPALPAPGELSSTEHRSSIGHTFSAASPTSLGGRGTIATGDPHHQRQASLGDIHNELEQEQEAQVNRMLQMIRTQQQQLESLHRAHPETGERNPAENTPLVDQPTPGSERSFSFNRPTSMSRNPSSAGRSPALRAISAQDSHASSTEWSPLESARRNSIRDENAYYQAETANLTRENQMLKHRIRELEKQVAELNDKPANSPPTPSNLVTSPVLKEQAHTSSGRT